MLATPTSKVREHAVNVASASVGVRQRAGDRSSCSSEGFPHCSAFAMMVPWSDQLLSVISQCDKSVVPPGCITVG